MKTRGFLLSLVFAVVALASASPASAYTYTFVNSTGKPIRQIWMHTVSSVCHDVNWRGNLAPGASVNVNSASICLVDRVEVNGGQIRWSESTGRFGGTFFVARDGVCLFSGTEALLVALSAPGVNLVAPPATGFLTKAALRC